MALLCCLVTAVFGFSFLVSRRLCPQIGTALALAVPLACSLAVLGSKMWSSVGGRWPTAGFCLVFSLLLLLRPSQRDDDKPLSPAGPPALSLLGILALQLHFQTQTLDAQSWWNDAQAAALSSGLSPELPFLVAAQSDALQGATPYAKFLAFLLPTGWDPLSLQWVLAPLLLLSSVKLLWHSLIRWEPSSVVTLCTVLAVLFGSHLGKADLLLEHWQGSLPLILCLLLSSIWWIQELLATVPTARPAGDPELRFLIWALLVYALGTLSAELYWLLGLLTAALVLATLLNSTYRKVGQGLLGFSLLSLAVIGQSLRSVPMTWQSPPSPAEFATLGPIVFLAPVTLVWVLRYRHWPALIFWLLGFLAVVVPGPTTEQAILRLSVVALSFAVPFGLTAGSLLTTKAKLSRSVGVAFLCLAIVPGVISAAPSFQHLRQEGGWPLMSPPSLWRVQRPEFGVDRGVIDCAQALSSRLVPGEVLLTNLGNDQTGAAPDSVIASLTGARIEGWRPLPNAQTPTDYYRSSLSLALQSSGRPDLLWTSGVSWLLTRAGNTSLDQALKSSRHARLEYSQSEGDERYQLWHIAPSPSLAVERLPSQPPFRNRTLLFDGEAYVGLAKGESLEWQPSSPYRLEISAFNEQERTARLGWLRLEVQDQNEQLACDPLFYLLGANPLPPQTGDLQEVVFITPRENGVFRVRGLLLMENAQTATLFEFSISISGNASRDSSS